jgi:hypothetical protein
VLVGLAVLLTAAVLGGAAWIIAKQGDEQALDGHLPVHKDISGNEIGSIDDWARIAPESFRSTDNLLYINDVIPGPSETWLAVGYVVTPRGKRLPSV